MTQSQLIPSHRIQPLLQQLPQGAGLQLLTLMLLAGIHVTAMVPVLSCPSRCIQIAQASVNRATLKPGSRGAEVSELQAALKLLGYFSGTVDGIFGGATTKAVTAFQRASDIEADGIVGATTWNRLFPATATAAAAEPSPTPTPPATPRPTPTPTPRATPTPNAGGPTQPVSAQPRAQVNLPVLKLGTRGAAVTALQERLKAAGYFRGGVDGVFGVETQNAVKAAQRNYQLEPDGVVGASTWNVLMRSR